MVVGHEDQDVRRGQIHLPGASSEGRNANCKRDELRNSGPTRLATAQRARFEWPDVNPAGDRSARTVRQNLGWSHGASMILHDLHLLPSAVHQYASKSTLRTPQGASYSWSWVECRCKQAVARSSTRPSEARRQRSAEQSSIWSKRGRTILLMPAVLLSGVSRIRLDSLSRHRECE